MIDRLEVSKTPWGEISYLPHDDPIGVSLRELNEWAGCEILLLRSLIGPRDAVVEVGANIGTHTVALAKRVGPDGSIVAFEPQPQIADILERNITSNGLTNCHVVRAGAGRSDEKLWLPDLCYDMHGNFGAVALVATKSSDESIDIPVRTIDSLNLSRCDLLKIDAEGMEADVLEGASNTIDLFKPIIFLEANTLQSCIPALRMIDKELYDFFVVVSPVNPFNEEASGKNVFGFASETSVLALPRSLSEAFDFAGSRATVTKFSTFDELAVSILQAPRSGDKTDYVRNADATHKALSDQIGELSTTIEGLTTKITGLTSEMADIEAELSRSRYRENLYRVQLMSSSTSSNTPGIAASRVDFLERQAVDLLRQVNAYRHSTSWFITAPFRWVVIVARKLRSRLRG